MWQEAEAAEAAELERKEAMLKSNPLLNLSEAPAERATVKRRCVVGEQVVWVHVQARAGRWVAVTRGVWVAVTRGVCGRVGAAKRRRLRDSEEGMCLCARARQGERQYCADVPTTVGA